VNKGRQEKGEKEVDGQRQGGKIMRKKRAHTVPIAHLSYNRTHIELDWSDIGISLLGLLAVCLEESELISKILF
jgi:hypothetical protein